MALVPPSGEVVKCFVVLVQIAKRSVDEVLMLYFQNICQLLRALPPDPLGAPFMDFAGGRKSQTPNLPNPGKNYAGVHAPYFIL